MFLHRSTNSHLIILHHLPQSASQHATGHLVVPHLSQKPVRPKELRVPPSATQLPPPPPSEQGLQRTREGARQQPSEEARRVPLSRLPLWRRRVRGFMGVVWRGEDRDWTVRVTWDDTGELLRVDVHGLGPAPQHLRESGNDHVTAIIQSQKSSSVSEKEITPNWAEILLGLKIKASTLLTQEIPPICGDKSHKRRNKNKRIKGCSL